MSIFTLDILLVEDSRSDVELFMLAHQVNGSAATIRVARDGMEAVEALHSDKSRPGDAPNVLPRLVLLDLNMPRLNGFEVLKRLRADERTRQLPVVIFSGSDQRSDMLEAERLGANGYVRKPVEFENLCATLAQFERDWLSADLAPLHPTG
ncbi:response regulator [Polaromonas sp.]|uniref:response regulator n=1 Tax=Polaromonas sp. TaxID=1869339 RepID=UPI002FC9E8C5